MISFSLWATRFLRWGLGNNLFGLLIAHLYVRQLKSAHSYQPCYQTPHNSVFDGHFPHSFYLLILMNAISKPQLNLRN